MVTARQIDHIRTGVGFVGNVISFGLFLSPAPTFWKIHKKGAVEDFSPNPYLATILNCVLWVYYGLPFVHAHDTLVVTINGIGIGIELIYVCIFLIYATKKGRRYVLRVFAGEAVFYAAVVLLLTLEPTCIANRSTIIGVLCDIFNILMYAMPLDNLYQVYKSKSSYFMPAYLLLFNALNGGCWLAFALLHFDIYLLVSNGLGFVFGLIQIGVWWWYRNGPKPEVQIDDEAVKAKELAMV
ncbi:hypothetical protein MKX03_002504 [Papaver bracteatum]|nr:hypothetical protein MKX03_002504 [Papaver bracteatum]